MLLCLTAACACGGGRPAQRDRAGVHVRIGSGVAVGSRIAATERSDRAPQLRDVRHPDWRAGRQIGVCVCRRRRPCVNTGATPYRSGCAGGFIKVMPATRFASV